MIVVDRMDYIQIARVVGIPIYIHLGGLLIFSLLAWTLSTGYFPAQRPDLPVVSYGVAGLVTSLLLLGSIALHELGRAVVGVRRGLAVRPVTLFTFGGVGQLDSDPTDSGIRLRMAAAGPLVSLTLAGLFYTCAILPVARPSMVAAVTYLILANLSLALFSLVPTLPMDGGRLLRGAVGGPLASAHALWTRSGAGSLLAFFLTFSGLFSLLRGDSAAGAWSMLLGWLIKNDTSAACQQMRLEEILHSVTVREAMVADVATVPGRGSVAEAVEGRLMRGAHKSYPVTRGNAVVGLLFRSDALRLSGEERKATSVQGSMRPLADTMVVDPEAMLPTAIAKMALARTRQLLVVEGDRLLGLLTINGVMRRLRGEARSSGGMGSVSTMDDMLQKGIRSSPESAVGQQHHASPLNPDRRDEGM
jgi:Zn-dependent protease/CBS domain-containing protein